MSPSTNLLQRTVCAVVCRGELVAAQFGNITFTLEFQTALELACALKLAARQAKIIAGDRGKWYRTLGTLTDLNAVKVKPSRFGRSLPERLALKDLAVRHEGQIVYLRIGRTELGIPYQAAATIAQWFRLRAKEARNAAGEGAHWSKLVNADSPRILTTGG